MDITTYTIPVIMLTCAIIGFLVKHVIRSEKVDRFIPLIVAVLGVVLNIWMHSWAFSIDILLGGLASGLASTGVYELIHQQIKSIGGGHDDVA